MKKVIIKLSALFLLIEVASGLPIILILYFTHTEKIVGMILLILTIISSIILYYLKGVKNMNKFNNQYYLIFHLHNEVMDYVYGQRNLEKEIRSKEDAIKRLLEENSKLANKIHELENKENKENE